MCNLTTIPQNNNNFYVACCMGKSHMLPSQYSKIVYTEPLKLVDCDLWGPAPMVSFIGYKYYVSFIAFNCNSWIYFIKTNYKTWSKFNKFKFLVELQLNTKIKAIQTNYGVSLDLHNNL